MDADTAAVRDLRREFVETSSSFSWNDYITVVLLESGHVSAASVQSLESGNLWAGSPGFKLSFKEVKSIQNAFEDDSQLRLQGLLVGGRPFTVTRISGLRLLVGRDAKTGAGAVIYVCRRCLLAAVYEEGNHPGTCYNLVTQLGDYLLNSGF
ncbi:profilin [Plakobranchus ocellatus]|uniref:Profilin n=1 Tax=Plakobranchus ocellatus TaxID=259542 RepID=A0AAV4AAJ6_9GAST|nr:profilin [Plakobranchus ocellatus]